jgi:7-carboxy-7-deazaguanine synthase
MLYLVEHFYSIQGEGKHTGVPSLFFRFGGCNLTCPGFGCSEITPDGREVTGCDTVYAVDRKGFGELWQEIEELQTLIWIMNGYRLPPHVDVVLTGGEPLIYANEPIFVEFIDYLIGQGHRVTFETNATVALDFKRYPFYAAATYALSVKLSNSGEPLNRRVKPEVIESILAHTQGSFFKFSVDEPSLLSKLEEEIDAIVASHPFTPVYCMPLGGDKAHIEANCEAVIEFCKRRGFIYSDRLHIRIWDQNHGV